MRRLIGVFGPGLVVMLADSDVGSIITAGQGGVRWGYRLLLLQFVLIPILYMVQELTVRLGIFTGRGHGELVRERFGPGWAWVSASTLGVATIGALLTEFAGVAGVGELYGVPRAVTLPLAAGALLLVALTGSYRRVERVAIAIGLFEFAFFFVAWMGRPTLHALLHGAVDIPLADRNYLYLVAANIGTMIVPWMIFYQQSAVADRKLRPEDLGAARVDTAIGALLTQLVMAAVLVACAATIGKRSPDASLTTVGEMAQALTPLLGTAFGNAVFSAGVLGAAMVAAIVASLAFAWGLGEIAGYRRALERHPLETRWFYGVFAASVVGGAGAVAAWPDLVALNVGVQVLNMLMLPLLLGFLIALARRALAPAQRLRGAYFWTVLAVSVVTCTLGVLAGIAGTVPWM